MGGLGNDYLWGDLPGDLGGGLGSDVFEIKQVGESLANALARDVIFDFDGAGSAGGDQIKLSLIDANELLSGNQAFTYIGSNAFTAAGQLRYLGGILSGSTDADSLPELQIELVDAPTLFVSGAAGSDILL